MNTTDFGHHLDVILRELEMKEGSMIAHVTPEMTKLTEKA
jgi:hypothetical protein